MTKEQIEDKLMEIFSRCEVKPDIKKATSFIIRLLNKKPSIDDKPSECKAWCTKGSTNIQCNTIPCCGFLAGASFASPAVSGQGMWRSLSKEPFPNDPECLIFRVRYSNPVKYLVDIDSFHPDHLVVNGKEYRYHDLEYLDESPCTPSGEAEGVQAMLQDWRSGKYADFSHFTAQEKSDLIGGLIQIVAKEVMMWFYACGLKTHIESRVVNESTNEEFRFSFIRLPESIPPVQEGEAVDWDNIFTNAPVRIHPKTEQYLIDIFKQRK